MGEKLPQQAADEGENLPQKPFYGAAAAQPPLIPATFPR